MSRVWYAKDADFLEDPAIVELGERYGAAGPLVIDALLGLAKMARDGGRVTIGPTALARRAFVEDGETCRAILRDAASFGVLELEESGPVKCEVTFPQWDKWQAAFRKARQRAREAEQDDRDASVTNRDRSDPPLSRVTEDREQESSLRSDSNGASPLVEPVRLDALFAYWQERCDHSQAKFTKDRRRKLVARIREGYSDEQLRVAIDGAAAEPYVNPDGKRFDDLELICRNGSKLEDFIERGERHRGEDPADFTARLNARSAA